MSRPYSASQRDTVLVPYPFSDLSHAKYRPAIVMSNDAYNRKFKDFIGIPLTTNPNTRDHTVPVTSKEMATGSLTAANVASGQSFQLGTKASRENLWAATPRCFR